MKIGDLAELPIWRKYNTNLNKLTFISKLIRKYSNELKLTSSWTGYNKYGKGVKHRLRFNKSGNMNIEDNYATHYINKTRLAELKTKQSLKVDANMKQLSTE